MSKKHSLYAEMEKIFREKGSEALKNAKNEIPLIYKMNNHLSKALQFFSNSTLQDPMPVFPALVTLSCEAVGDRRKSLFLSVRRYF